MSRPTPRRSSLAGSSPVQPPEQPATAPAAAESEKAKAATPKPPKQAAPALVIASTDAKGESRVVRQGIYITADEFADAKRANLADWQAGGQADTFARWIVPSPTPTRPAPRPNAPSWRAPRAAPSTAPERAPRTIPIRTSASCQHGAIASPRV